MVTAGVGVAEANLQLDLREEGQVQNVSVNRSERALRRPGALRRWLYRGRRPNCIAKIFVRAWASVVSLGFGSSTDVTLEVTGRKSGRSVKFPLVMAVVDGQRYLVSMLGEDVQ